MIITDLTWLKKFVNIACFQIYKIIERLVWSRLAVNGTIRPLKRQVFERGEHSKQSIYLSQNDFLILRTLV